ncbi:MAG TPA: iron ABC transporter permease [Solirubrobacterales bacterium]
MSAAAPGRRPPAALLVAAAAVAVLAALPAVYLAVVVGDDLAAAVDSVWNSRSAELIVRSVGLAAAVTATGIAIAVPIAWLTTRTDLPGARVWATLATLPLVIPSYIGAYLFVSALGPSGALQDLLEPLGVDRLPSIYGFGGAWLVLTLFSYPVILLTVRASLRRLDPQLEEAARAMGRTPLQAFRSVVLPQLRPAMAAGGLLVALYVLSDFGAVSIMRFNSFTREIYITFTAGFDRTGAAALAVLLVAVTVAVLVLYSRARSRLRLHRASPGTARPARPVPLGRWRWPALGFCAAIVLVALVLPVGVLVYWAIQGIGDDAGIGGLAVNAGHSLAAGGLTALIAALLAIVVAVLVVRYPGRISRGLERVSYTGYALPGIVVALALVFFGIRVAPPLYQSFAMLVVALTAHFLPLAIGAIGAALLQISPRVEEAARGLGRGPLGVFRTITAPLALGGIAAGAALVFLNAVKELPATLILAPIGFETLATDIWRQTTTGFFEAGAVPALVLLCVAAPPLYLLTGRSSPA